MPPKAPETPSWQSRILDLPKLVEDHDPDAPRPWVVEPLVIDGTLGIVAGKSGAGKTWVVHEAADAVARGTVKAGLMGYGPRPVLIIDAEMGQWLTVDRFKSQGYCTDPNLMHVFNAQGMDLKRTEDRQMIWDAALAILGNGGLLIVDSLRAIVPSAKENDSDDMAPVVTWLKNLCRKTGAAGLLIHHSGWREERTRGSSAIKDQADTIWYLGANDDGVLRLTCQGPDLKAPRWGPPPRDLYLRLQDTGGLVTADSPRERATERREAVLRAISDADEQGSPLKTKADVARAMGQVSATGWTNDLLTQLTRDGMVHKDSKGFLRVDEALGEAREL